MTRPLKVGVSLAAAGLLALIVYSTLQQNQYEVEVCMNFQGRSHCANAAGPTPEEAIRTAQSTACALITSGREENMVCLSRQPASVRRISR